MNQTSGPARFVRIWRIFVHAAGTWLERNAFIHAGSLAFYNYAEGWIPLPAPLLSGVELGVSFVVFTILFAVIFKVLPDAVIEWSDVWVGAATTTALFIAGRCLIAFYLAYKAPASPYGAAGSLVLLLLWVYYSSLILFFGAALTKARVIAAGREVVPRPLAVRVKEVLLEES